MQAFTFELDTPLQPRSERPQSLVVLQVLTHVFPIPDTLSQIDPSGQPSVEPGVVHDVVQYPPGIAVLHVSGSSQSLAAVHVLPVFGDPPQLAVSKTSRIEMIRIQQAYRVASLRTP